MRLTADSAGTTGPDGRRPLIGLKQHLGNPVDKAVPDGGTTALVSTDRLIQGALTYLLERSESYIDLNPAMLTHGRLNHAVMTYPTIAPPSVRHDLRRFLEDPVHGPGLTLVDTSYDEAIAAVMFFLMRDLGGEYEVGVEAVKTRYEPMDATTWAQNILVIDIGGGTTDIALVTMTLKDQTALVPDRGDDPRWSGRYYVLTPKVQGSTGILQLGGEYLTLRVFEWLKAVLVDILLTTFPHHYQTAIQSPPDKKYGDGTAYTPGSLVKAMLAGEASPSVLDYLESVVPTRWAANPVNEQAFWLLWQLADNAKLALGAADAAPFPVSRTDLAQVVNAIATATGGSAPSLDDLADPVATLAPESFDGLVGEPLADVMERATELAASRLRGERLHRIILTGKSSGLDQVHRTLLTHFGKDVTWDASAVLVERDNPKLATAVGACWAESVRQLAFLPENAGRRLREGKTVLDIAVENLFFNLPCAFNLNELEQSAERIPTGKELFQLDEEDVGKARSEAPWADPLTPTVTVYRKIKDGEYHSWGSFKYAEYQQLHEPGPALGPAWPNEMFTNIEVSHTLDVSLMVCRGKPHYVVDGSSVDVLDAVRSVYGADRLGPGGTMPEELPGSIKVDSLIAGSTTRSSIVVFPGGEPLVWTETFFEADDDSATPVNGLLAATDLPVASDRRNRNAADTWVFTLEFDGGEKEIGRLSRPRLGQDRFPTRYRASLDEQGRLRVHAGEVPYRTARTLREVEQPGRVFKRRLEPDRPQHDESRDPFNGRH